MKLTHARISHFQSVHDSGKFEIGDITCLVGKNESGKTALLKALNRLQPLVTDDAQFDVTDDYPRQRVSAYKRAVRADPTATVAVVQGWYELSNEDAADVQAVFGTDCFGSQQAILELSRGYTNELQVASLSINDDVAIRHLLSAAGLPKPLTDQLLDLNNIDELMATLTDAEHSEAKASLQLWIETIAVRGLPTAIFDRLLAQRTPKFLYFDEYYQIRGQDNLDALRRRVAAEQLEPPDHPLLGLIDRAGLDLDELANPERTESLLGQLEGAENQLTEDVLKHWSQNRHLRMKFDVRKAEPNDPPGMTSGVNIWGRVFDTKHSVSTALGSRSRGFVWFFSFLAWYSQLQQQGENLILLLDEPGLSLHAKAQADLLRFFEAELKPHHQVMYTTHSPFMVDPAHFDRVRIVQDLSIESESSVVPVEQEGTMVITEVLDATEDSLFPLQGALGYEIHQTLFVGPNNLVVEGASDLLYIQALSNRLQEDKRDGLSEDWTIVPVGGAGNVATFVALLGGQKDLNVAVLIDYHKKDQQAVENLYKSRLLMKKKVLTYAAYVDADEADIEDMFDRAFYLRLVTGAYEAKIKEETLQSQHPRILQRIEEHIAEHPLPNGARFNHYRPASHLHQNMGTLAKNLSQKELDRFQRMFDDLNALL